MCGSTLRDHFTLMTKRIYEENDKTASHLLMLSTHRVFKLRRWGVESEFAAAIWVTGLALVGGDGDRRCPCS